MILVAGEALIDLIASDGALRPHPGGGPFNTALALGRLGVPVGFFGRLSDDAFGRLLESRFLESGVDVRYVLHGSEPTPLAVVQETDGGGHEFSFYLADTAYARIGVDDLPELADDVTALYSGTLGLATDPPAAALEDLLQEQSARRLVVIDPNVRPAVIPDVDEYRRRFERLATVAHVVKLSDADAQWLYPAEPVEAVVTRLLEQGVLLAVMTLGAEGAIARNAVGEAAVGSPTVDVVDTVGAGDAFGAGLLRELWENDRLDASSVGTLDASALEDALRFAAAAAALQCARPGATPPTLLEVEAFLAGQPA